MYNFKHFILHIKLKTQCKSVALGRSHIQLPLNPCLCYTAIMYVSGFVEITRMTNITFHVLYETYIKYDTCIYYMDAQRRIFCNKIKSDLNKYFYR